MIQISASMQFIGQGSEEKYTSLPISWHFFDLASSVVIAKALRLYLVLGA